MKKLIKFTLGITLPIFIFSIYSCVKHTTPPTIEIPLKIKLSNSPTLGSYMTDKDGRALYFFANDYDGKNNCPGGCELVWPYFFADSLAKENLGDTSIHLADITTIVAADGKKQLAYKGWPLYYYAPAVGGVNTQEAPGLTGGEGVGNTWFVAKPDYTIMIANGQLVGANGKSYKSDYTEGVARTAYFTDAWGITLYAFTNDRANKNNFTKSDFSNLANWPIYENTKVVVPSILDKALFGSIDVFTKKQMTYKTWPMYHYGADSLIRGRNKGVSIGAAPGFWPVVVKDIPAATP